MDTKVLLGVMVFLTSGVCVFLQFQQRRWLLVMGYACLAASSLLRNVKPENTITQIAGNTFIVVFAICAVLEFMRKRRAMQSDVTVH